jgi:hypothetical protein
MTTTTKLTKLNNYATAYLNSLDPYMAKTRGAEIIRDQIEAISKALPDVARIDWLADTANHLGNVELPEKCVDDNINSMRDAIDQAMTMEQ